LALYPRHSFFLRGEEAQLIAYAPGAENPKYTLPLTCVYCYHCYCPVVNQ